MQEITVTYAVARKKVAVEFTAKYFQVYSRAREWQELGLDGRWKQTAGIKVSAKLCFFLTSIATVLLNVFLKGSLC